MANLSGFEDFSDLLLHVYRLSHEQPLQAFQDEALDALRRVLPFDSSMWGSATLGPENVFTISQGSCSGVGGMGLKARTRCAVDGLSPREHQVAWLLARGLTHKEVARQLGRSPATVRNQIQSIYARLEISSVAQLVALLHEAMD